MPITCLLSTIFPRGADLQDSTSTLAHFGIPLKASRGVMNNYSCIRLDLQVPTIGNLTRQYLTHTSALEMGLHTHNVRCDSRLLLYDTVRNSANVPSPVAAMFFSSVSLMQALWSSNSHRLIQGASSWSCRATTACAKLLSE